VLGKLRVRASTAELEQLLGWVGHDAAFLTRQITAVFGHEQPQ
jgi:hypothetical protein